MNPFSSAVDKAFDKARSIWAGQGAKARLKIEAAKQRKLEDAPRFDDTRRRKRAHAASMNRHGAKVARRQLLKERAEADAVHISASMAGVLDGSLKATSAMQRNVRNRIIGDIRQSVLAEVRDDEDFQAEPYAVQATEVERRIDARLLEMGLSR